MKHFFQIWYFGVCISEFFIFRRLSLQEFVSSGVCLVRSLSFRSLSFRSLSFRSLSFRSLSFRSLSRHPGNWLKYYVYLWYKSHALSHIFFENCNFFSVKMAEPIVLKFWNFKPKKMWTFFLETLILQLWREERQLKEQHLNAKFLISLIERTNETQ